MRIKIGLAAAVTLLSLTATQSPAFAMAQHYTCAVGDMAEASDDVDVYNSPVEPRAAVAGTYDDHLGHRRTSSVDSIGLPP